MTACNQAIISAFEDLGLAPEEIAEQESLDVVAVKSILMQFSSKFRGDVKKGKIVGFNEEQEEMACQVIADIASGLVDDTDVNARLRAGIYIREDRQGRRDAVKSQVGLNQNVLVFNMQVQKRMQQAIAAKERSLVEVNS